MILLLLAFGFSCCLWHVKQLTTKGSQLDCESWHHLCQQLTSFGVKPEHVASPCRNCREHTTDESCGTWNSPTPTDGNDIVSRSWHPVPKSGRTWPGFQGSTHNHVELEFFNPISWHQMISPVRNGSSKEGSCQKSRRNVPCTNYRHHVGINYFTCGFAIIK